MADIKVERDKRIEAENKLMNFQEQWRFTRRTQESDPTRFSPLRGTDFKNHDE